MGYDKILQDIKTKAKGAAESFMNQNGSADHSRGFILKATYSSGSEEKSGYIDADKSYFLDVDTCENLINTEIWAYMLLIILEIIGIILACVCLIDRGITDGLTFFLAMVAICVGASFVSMYRIGRFMFHINKKLRSL